MTVYIHAEKELATLFTNHNQAYPALLSVPEYAALLKMGKPDVVLCQKKAAEITQRLRSSGGVREFGSREAVKATVCTREIFRAVGPKNNPYGDWWFDGDLVRRWERNYAGLAHAERKQKVLESLRPMLAVCNDWNDFTDLWILRPPAGGIPLLTGQGTAQPIFSKDSPQYDEKEKVVFIGGYQQMYVPFVPRSAASLYPF